MRQRLAAPFITQPAHAHAVLADMPTLPHLLCTTVSLFGQNLIYSTPKGEMMLQKANHWCRCRYLLIQIMQGLQTCKAGAHHAFAGPSCCVYHVQVPAQLLAAFVNQVWTRCRLPGALPQHASGEFGNSQRC